MIGLALLGLLGAVGSATAMSGAVVPLQGLAHDFASFVFMITAMLSTLGFVAADS